jgi:hypothetical protein
MTQVGLDPPVDQSLSYGASFNGFGILFLFENQSFLVGRVRDLRMHGAVAAVAELEQAYCRHRSYRLIY